MFNYQNKQLTPQQKEHLLEDAQQRLSEARAHLERCEAAAAEAEAAYAKARAERPRGKPVNANVPQARTVSRPEGGVIERPAVNMVDAKAIEGRKALRASWLRLQVVQQALVAARTAASDALKRLRFAEKGLPPPWEQSVLERWVIPAGGPIKEASLETAQEIREKARR